MSTTANDVTITGALSNVRPHDGGVAATLTHPEAQVWVIFPAGVTADDLNRIDRGRVTVHGTYSGPAIRVNTYEAGR